MNKQTLIFLGPQGSGKGTQIELLKKYIAEKDPARAVIQFGMGQGLRELATRSDFTGTKTDSILKNGGLIPYAISCSVFTQFLMDHYSGAEHLIIDGFPRTKDQVPALDSALEFFEARPVTVVCINISDEEAVKRLLLRGRSDDTEESIRTRLQWSREETMPNIEWFRTATGYNVLDIDGERTVEEIQADIIAQLGL
ncbi:MAG TPA: nucleoside monophosphate kinase [Candidatus Paceibacterota bacterium]|nr:nucleoside monophosphate kinase [Candidatus Paceibacterota bacterium]